MLDTLDHPTWKVVSGGSATYIPALVASPRIAVHLAAPPAAVVRTAAGARLSFPDRPPVDVDEVVFACHGDEVLPLLADASPLERAVLSAFRTTENRAVLHTDASFLPPREAAPAAWNYQIGDGTGATLTHAMHRLQGFRTPRQYCVTLNPTRPIAPSQVLAAMDYTHPLYTAAAVRAQARWADISGTHRTHYCGAYWFYGFHEDGLRSAVRVARALGVTW